MGFLSKAINQYRSFSVQVKASFWFTVCSVTQKVLALLTVPLFTRLMSTEDYGVLTLYQAWFNVIIIVTTLNLHLAVFNTAMIKFEEDRDRFTSSMTALTSVISIVTGALYFLLREKLNEIIGLETPIMLIMLAHLTFYPAYNFWAARQRFEYRYKALIIVTLTVAIASSALGVVAVTRSADKGTARVCAVAIVETLVYGVIYIRNLRRGKCLFDKKYWKYALLFALPLVPHYLSGSILNHVDRIMINSFVGSGKAAIYGVAYSVSMSAILFVNALNASYTPWLFGKLKRKDYSEIADISFDMMLMICVIDALLILFAPEIMYIIGGRKYQETVQIFPILSASSPCIFLYSLFAGIEFFFEQKYLIMVASVCAAMLNVALNYIFIPLIGYQGAAYTTLGCYVVTACLHFSFMNKVMKANSIPSSVYSSGKMFGLAFFVIAWSVICRIMFEKIVIRNVFLLICLAMAFVFRTLIIKYIKNVFQKLKN